MNCYERAAARYIDDVCEELAGKVIWRLQRLHSTMSGDDSGLTNVWDELCVQVQGEHSFFYDLYLDMAEQITRAALQDVNPHLLALIWLESNEGRDWQLAYDEDDPDAPGPAEEWVEADVVRYVLDEYVLRLAGEYTNKKIENYIYR